MDQQSKKKFTRTRDGCMCCRLRRKKCDGLKPTCKNCERNELICSWPSHLRETWVVTTSDQVTSDGLGVLSTSDTSLSKCRVPVLVSPAPETSACVVFPSWRQSVDHLTQQEILISTAIPRPMKHVVLRDHSSWMLFQMLNEHALIFFAPTMPVQNPFYRYVLPYSESHPQVAHILLALSGSFLQQISSENGLYTQSLTHYGSALQNLKTSLKKSQNGESKTRILLLLSTLLLCFRDGIDGCSSGYAFFVHLRAARDSAVWLSENRDLVASEDMELLGFLLEFYAYCVLMNQITFDDPEGMAVLSRDPVVASLRHLRDFESPGVLFGCSFELYELIPRICVFGRERQDAKANPRTDIENQHKMDYLELASRIVTWNLSESENMYGVALQTQASAGRLLQLAMSMFLHAAYHNDDPGNPELRTKIRPLLDEALILFAKLLKTPMYSCLGWVAAVVLSCVGGPDPRVCRLPAGPMASMNHMQDLLKILSMLWTSEDPAIYGPHGLSRLMKDHNIRLNTF